jgi:hypothetical protein
MWLGGNVPLGYGVRERKLVVNEAEASTVLIICKRYAVQSVDGALYCCICWNRAKDGARRERCEENDTASLRYDWKELLHKKERRALAPSMHSGIQSEWLGNIDALRWCVGPCGSSRHQGF